MAANSSLPSLVAGVDVSQFTRSDRILAQLQAQFGTMQPGKLQALRKQFYSYVVYPLAGANQLNFFGQAVGNAGATLEDTNMPVQGSFGTSAFLIKGIQCNYRLSGGFYAAAFAGTDATAFETEILGGLFKGGVLELLVNAKSYIQITQPFFQAPPADGRTRMYNQGQMDANTSVVPGANLSSRSENRYISDPEMFIAPQQNFSLSIGYPSGAIPVRATGIIDAGANTLRVGVELDGIEFRPVQ